MKKIELSDDQAGWVHDTDTRESYEGADLPTSDGDGEDEEDTA